MATILEAKQFTDQATKYGSIKGPLVVLLTDMVAWREVWLKAGREKQLDWLKGTKSPLMNIACFLYIFLKPFFEHLENDIESKKISIDLKTYKVKVN